MYGVTRLMVWGLLVGKKSSIFDIPSFLFIRLKKSIGLGAQNEGGKLELRAKFVWGSTAESPSQQAKPRQAAKTHQKGHRKNPISGSRAAFGRCYRG